VAEISNAAHAGDRDGAALRMAQDRAERNRALAPLRLVPAADWLALANRAAEPNGYFLPDWELAVDALARERGNVLALSGRNDTRSLDTYLGVGPIVGASLLLGNWKHLSVSASPALALVWFKPAVGSDSGSTTILAMQAALEGEVHLGFIGVPALSIGLLAGLGFQYESVAGTRLWSVGVLGGDSVWGALSNLFVRYYL